MTGAFKGCRLRVVLHLPWTQRCSMAFSFMKGELRIGTSGWSYKSWASRFYPEKLPPRRQLEYYVTQFNTVEINATFYRLPPESAVTGWLEKAPQGFIYALKGSRFITHMKKLTDVEGALEKYFGRIEPLAPKVGVILWQLPPMLQKDVPRLRAFLRQLPREYRYAVEFRHASWVDKDVFCLLEDQNVAHANLSSLGMPMDLTVTSDLVYIRFHGLQGGFAHDYTREELEPWARHIRSQVRRGRSVYAFFNNDANVRAPGNARTLREMCEGAGVKRLKHRIRVVA